MRVVCIAIVSLVLLASCSSVRVAADYDRQANFSDYKSFAFFKPGIDKADISDLDKKRILRAIEAEMLAKGFSKSDNPDMLISIFTKTRENVNIYQNNLGWGWGWGPGFWGGGMYNTASTTIEGTLFIDLIDASERELVWQGMGAGALSSDIERKEKRIREMVREVLEQYPPELEMKK